MKERKQFFFEKKNQKTFAILIALAAQPAHAHRVISLNLCTDELLTILAPEDIIALSPLARDPSLSTVADQATHFPRIRPDAEAVLALHPDLVLAGDYGAQATLAVLRAHNIRVLQLPEPTDFPGVATQVTQLAATLDVPQRAAAILARMQSTLRAIPTRPRARAILWQARGYTAGPASFGAAILRAAGLTNAGTGAQLGIEAMLARPPDLLVTEAAPTYPSLATTMLRHPALAALHRIAIDPAWLACPGPWSTSAVTALAQ